MSRALAYRLRVEVRRRWRTYVGLALLVAVLGGLVLAAAAGARRTSTAYDRLLAVVNPPELLVAPPGGPGADPTPFYGAIGREPGVRAIQLIAGLPILPEAGTSSDRLAEQFSGAGVIAPMESRDAAIGRPSLVAGRSPDPSRSAEILISQRFASATDLTVGDHIDAVLIDVDPSSIVALVATADQGLPIRLIVSGIGVLYDEVVPFSDLNESGSIVGTPALAALVADRSTLNFEGALVDVEQGVDLDGLRASIEALGRRDDLGTGGPVFVSNETTKTQQVSESMRPLAAALGVAAAAIGLVALLVIGQAVSRSTRELPSAVDALRAIGARPRDRLVFAATRAAVVGTAGAAGAVVIAVGLSGRFPIGVARVAEPDPGTHIDIAVLGIGAAAIVVLTTISAVPAALLQSRHRSPVPKASMVATAAAASGLPPAAVQGVRFAAVGGGARPIPLRSTLFTMTVAIMSVLATLAFAQSLGALLDTPTRYGQEWDRVVDAQFGPVPVAQIIDRLAAVPNVRGIGAGNYGDVTVNGTAVPAFDLESLRGTVSVRIVEGRAPASAEEIALGAETMRRLGVRVGDRVAVDAGDGARPMLLTGTGVFPRMGQGSFSATGLGVGAQLGGGSMPSFVGGELPEDFALDGRTYNFVAIDVAGSLTALDAELVEIETAAVAGGAFLFVRHEQPPTKIRDLARVRVVPAAMAGVLALVAVAALAHLLVTSVRERRRELALLSTLGFSRRQLYSTVGWHASMIALASLAVGAPIGILLGRGTWTWFAEGLDAAAPPETPWTSLPVAILATILIANLVAVIPARHAARTSPAVILRRE